MAVRALLQIDDESAGTVLRSPTLDVDPLLSSTHDVLLDLHDTMRAHPICVGLAAPQIGSSARVAVARVEDEEVVEMINPRVVATRGKKDTKRESCMSVWGRAGNVQRRDSVEVEFFNRTGQLVVRRFEGFAARVVQHEIDHLDGVIYDEHVDGPLQTTDLFVDESPEP